MNAPTIPTLQERLAQAIREKHVTMKPKWRLVLPHILVFSGAVLLALAVILHTSSLLYGLRVNGSWNLLRTGLGNLGYVLSAFPWVPAALLLALLLTLALIVSRTSRAYRLPILYSIIVIPLTIVGLSVLIENLPGHEQLQQFTTSSIPVVGAVFKNVAENEPANTYIGEVRNVNAGNFTLINRKGDAISVEVSGSTKLSSPTPVQDTQVVQVIGKASHGRVEAGSVQNVPTHFQEDVRERIHRLEQEKAREEQTEKPEAKEKPENTNRNRE